MKHYTSFETSVALRAAGAPQGDEEQTGVGATFWRAYRSGHHASPGKPLRCFEVRRPGWTWSPGSVDGAESDVEGMARSWRLDELLEALAAFAVVALRRHPVYGDGAGWYCEARMSSVGLSVADGSGHGSSSVEAAAACWLAVMRAKESPRA